MYQSHESLPTHVVSLSPSPSSCVAVQEVEETWAAGGPEEKIPLFKTFFFMTIKAITRCIFGRAFDDPTQVSKLTEAYFAAWKEMEVRTNVTHLHLFH